MFTHRFSEFYPYNAADYYRNVFFDKDKVSRFTSHSILRFNLYVVQDSNNYPFRLPY